MLVVYVVTITVNLLKNPTKKTTTERDVLELLPQMYVCVFVGSSVTTINKI